MIPFVKLLKPAGTMTTEAGRREAERRAEFLRRFLDQIGGEL